MKQGCSIRLRHALIFMAAIFIHGQAQAESISRNGVQSIIDKYGYEAAIKTLVSLGDGSVTTSGGSVTFGRPAMDLISVETISKDLERNHISLAAFEASIRKNTEHATSYVGQTTAPITSSPTTDPVDSLTSDEALTSTCASSIRDRLLDPDSMRITLQTKPMFSTTNYKGTTIVVRKVFMLVTAKNSLGGYVQSQPWACVMSEHSGKLLDLIGPGR